MSENIFDKALISTEEWEKVKISRVNTRPNAKSSYGTGSYTASDTKALFDAQGNLFRLKHNALVNYARAEESARASAEAARVEAEKLRVAAEGSVEEQTGRAWAEYLRAKAEEKRQETFETNEAARQETFETNEAARQKNEDERIQNDIERGQKIETIKQRVDNLTNAVNPNVTPYAIPQRDNNGNIAIQNDATVIGAKRNVAVSGLAVNQYVASEIAKLVDGAPETMNTLKEIAEMIDKEDTSIDIMGRLGDVEALVSGIDTSLDYMLDVQELIIGGGNS